MAVMDGSPLLISINTATLLAQRCPIKPVAYRVVGRFLHDYVRDSLVSFNIA